jgi:hypothetical protein
MQYSAAVTFEGETTAPRTWRGEFVAGTPSSAVSLAVRKAKKALPGLRWTSIVVLIEKKGESSGS